MKNIWAYSLRSIIIPLWYTWSSPHKNIQWSKRNVGGRIKREAYCTVWKEVNEEAKMVEMLMERQKGEREWELFWVQDPRPAFLTEWRDPDGRELLASRWLTARYIRSGFVREAGSFSFSVSRLIVVCIVSKSFPYHWLDHPLSSARLTRIRLCRRIWRLTSLHRHGGQGKRFRTGWCVLLTNGMQSVFNCLKPPIQPPANDMLMTSATSVFGRSTGCQSIGNVIVNLSSHGNTWWKGKKRVDYAYSTCVHHRNVTTLASITWFFFCSCWKFWLVGRECLHGSGTTRALTNETSTGSC